MKKRSEIKKRSEVTTTNTTTKPTTSAAERTVSMPFDEMPKKRGVVHCDACDTDIKVTDITSYRDDKSGECPECGGSISAGALNAADRVVIDENGDDGTEVEATKGAQVVDIGEALKIEGLERKVADGSGLARSVKNPEAKWCGECGAEWPIVHNHYWPNCGHSTAQRIDDPRKARKLAPPAGLQTRTLNEVEKRDADDAKRKDEPRPGGGSRATQPVDVQKEATTKSASPPAPRMSVEREGESMKLSIEWGKSTFPVAAYQNFTVGSFFVSRTVPHDASVLDEGRKILEELRLLADAAFESQADWYAEKLGKLK